MKRTAFELMSRVFDYVLFAPKIDSATVDIVMGLKHYAMWISNRDSGIKPDAYGKAQALKAMRKAKAVIKAQKALAAATRAHAAKLAVAA